jgi:hypothetical protein
MNLILNVFSNLVNTLSLLVKMDIFDSGILMKLMNLKEMIIVIITLNLKKKFLLKLMKVKEPILCG